MSIAFAHAPFWAHTKTPHLYLRTGCITVAGYEFKANRPLEQADCEAIEEAVADAICGYRAATAPLPEHPDAAETAVLRSAIDAASLAAFSIKERLEAGGLTDDQVEAATAARAALDAAFDACTAYDLTMDGVLEAWEC